MIKTSIAISETLFDQVQSLALRLNIPQSQLFESAIETYISNYPGQPAASEQAQSSDQAANAARPTAAGSRAINQGENYWVDLQHPNEMEAGIAHPHVVLQDNLFNHSRIHTVVVCALTSNIKRIANTPGNVLLEAGEANLPKQSVVEVSKISTVDKSALGEYIGSLSEERIREILAGMRFLQKSFFAR